MQDSVPMNEIAAPPPVGRTRPGEVVAELAVYDYRTAECPMPPTGRRGGPARRRAQDWNSLKVLSLRDHTVADLKMPNGRIYRATWRAIGQFRAWHLGPGQSTKRHLEWHEPAAFRVLAEGIGARTGQVTTS